MTCGDGESFRSNPRTHHERQPAARPAGPGVSGTAASAAAAAAGSSFLSPRSNALPAGAVLRRGEEEVGKWAEHAV